jgi:hypothetical protein
MKPPGVDLMPFHLGRNLWGEKFPTNFYFKSVRKISPINKILEN